MKTENYEVIFAIVNAGFAEDVMDVTRENGARGGTILNARGVVKEDLSLIHISEPTRQAEISYAVFCLKKKK